MSDTKPRYGLRLTKARIQRMEAHVTYQPQTLLALEERQPLSQSPSIQALAEQRELAGLGSNAIVRISATGEGFHIIFNEDEAPPQTRCPRPRPRRVDPATRAARELATIRRMSSVPSIGITQATPKVTPHNSMSNSMRLRSASVAAVVSNLPVHAFLTPCRYTPTFRRKIPNAPQKKIPGRATPAPRARSPSPPIVRVLLSRTPSVTPFTTSSSNTVKKPLFPKLEEQSQRRKSARLTINAAQSTVAGICAAQHRQAKVEQVTARQIRRQSRPLSIGPDAAATPRRYGSETLEQERQRHEHAGGTPGPDFSPDPAYSSRPRYKELCQLFPKNAQASVAGPSRQRRVCIVSPTPAPRVHITDPAPIISLADQRVFNAVRRAPAAHGPVWVTNDGRVLVGVDGKPEQPQAEEIHKVQIRGLGPHGTEQFDGLGRRVFVVKETVQRGSDWYSPTSGVLPTLQEE